MYKKNTDGSQYFKHEVDIKCFAILVKKKHHVFLIDKSVNFNVFHFMTLEADTLEMHLKH